MMDDRELILSRIIDAPQEVLFRCWTEPQLMTQWFTPPPFKTVLVQNDLRPGGSCLVVMEGPDGQQIPNPGVYLDVVKNERLVFTDAFTEAWLPSAKAFLTVTLTFEDAGSGKTKYTAVARHWTAEDCKAHEAMGFHQGWGIATDQLAALAKTLA